MQDDQAPNGNHPKKQKVIPPTGKKQSDYPESERSRMAELLKKWKGREPTDQEVTLSLEQEANF